MRSLKTTLPFLAALAFVAPTSLVIGCSGGAGPNGSSTSSEGDALEVHPGHGVKSIAESPAQVSNGDRTNPYDTTDDPTDPTFVPQPSQLKSYPKTDVAQAQAPLSTTSGTSFQLTYYVVSLRPANDPNEVTIKDCNGNFLTNASRAWRDDAVMQGTARYQDSSGTMQTINAGQGCWVKLSYAQRWGLGVENPATGNDFELRVFRSIAVDRSVLTIGKWYYIKELDGVQMPTPASTLVHDGCVRAVDIGPAIQGRHIDFFSGYLSAYQSLINGNSTMGGKESVTMYDGADKCAVHVARGY